MECLPRPICLTRAPAGGGAASDPAIEWAGACVSHKKKLKG
jgi:hypothetical protein